MSRRKVPSDQAMDRLTKARLLYDLAVDWNVLDLLLLIARAAAALEAAKARGELP